ncbi:F-box protein PP2-B7-like [Rutidosis leptorrhynchoides]|uniref:F-box protein PP2-B7-like n=1 Tax=Rutidosis leptorrhynchoides TaxID=125765 RepID=UPI003A99CB80
MSKALSFESLTTMQVKREKVETLKEVQVPEPEWITDMTELSNEQVCVVKTRYEDETMSPDTEYMCYFIFKLSENCHGLHCPVIVRDVLRWKNKDTRIVYFRQPSESNLPDNCWVPEEREDGYMEVLIGKFNSTSDIRDGGIPIHLKLIAYEGNFSGLIQGAYDIRKLL